MSTKTNFKRIAFVAIASLGFGVLTSFTPANAAAPDDIDGGDVVTTSVVATTPGLCQVDTTADSQDLTIVSGYSFVLSPISSAATENGHIVVSGNLTVASHSGFDTVTVTTATATTMADADTLTIKAGSVGTGKVSISSTSTTAVVEVIAVTIVAACAGSTVSPTYSFVAAISAADAIDTNAEASNSDTTGATLVSTTITHGYMGIKLANAYNGTLDEGAMIATVTSGEAYVNIANESGTEPAAGSAKTAVLASTGAKVVVKVTPITAGTPTVATVQVTYGGAIVGSRTFTFEGYASSIVISDVVIGKVGADSAGNGVYFRYLVKDAAGNNLRDRSISNDSTANSPSTVTDISSGFVDGDTDGTDATDGSKSADITTANLAAGTVANIICTKDGRTSVGVKYADPNNVGVTVKASVPVICADPLDTWAISMDKASYAPGEIATLTVTGKDENGLPAPTLVAMAGIEYSFGGMTAITAPTNGDLFNSGAGTKTYKFAVGTTEGAFVGTFKVTGATDTAAKTVQYKVANPTGTVSNADVLKSIVSLIASINKQIQALQKLILKR
jgi:hypothetical protein